MVRAHFRLTLSAYSLIPRSLIHSSLFLISTIDHAAEMTVDIADLLSALTLTTPGTAGDLTPFKGPLCGIQGEIFQQGYKIEYPRV